MMSKNILVISGHPNEHSLGHSLALAYAEGAMSAGHNVTIIRPDTLAFDPIFRWWDKERVASEDIARAQEVMRAADHIVIQTPVWWGSLPPTLKSFIDHTLQPGFAFKYKANGIPEKLFAGKTARILMTMDSPHWWDKYVYRSPAFNMLKRATLEYCGVKTSGTFFTKVKKSTPSIRAVWLSDARALGTKAA